MIFSLQHRSDLMINFTSVKVQIETTTLIKVDDLMTINSYFFYILHGTLFYFIFEEYMVHY